MARPESDSLTNSTGLLVSLLGSLAMSALAIGTNTENNPVWMALLLALAAVSSRRVGLLIAVGCGVIVGLFHDAFFVHDGDLSLTPWGDESELVVFALTAMVFALLSRFGPAFVRYRRHRDLSSTRSGEPRRVGAAAVVDNNDSTI